MTEKITIANKINPTFFIFFIKMNKIRPGNSHHFHKKYQCCQSGFGGTPKYKNVFRSFENFNFILMIPAKMVPCIGNEKPRKNEQKVTPRFKDI